MHMYRQLCRVWDKKRSDIKQEGQKTLKFFKQLGAKDFVMPSDAYVQQLHRIWDKKRSDIKQEGPETVKVFVQ